MYKQDLDEREFNELVGKIFSNIDDSKLYMKQLQNTMNVDNNLYYHLEDFISDLDRIDKLILNYSLTK